jgi:hypothetical protein
MDFLKGNELCEERIVLLVGYQRIVADIVAEGVLVELFTEVNNLLRIGNAHDLFLISVEITNWIEKVNNFYMLTEIFLDVGLVCGTILCLLSTLVAIKWSWFYLFGQTPATPVKIEPLAVLSGTIQDPKVGIVPSVTRPSVVEKAPIAPLPVFEVSASIEVPETEITCGKCGQAINSARVETKISRRGNTDIYQCEHCGAQVGIPVSGA